MSGTSGSVPAAAAAAVSPVPAAAAAVGPVPAAAAAVGPPAVPPAVGGNPDFLQAGLGLMMKHGVLLGLFVAATPVAITIGRRMLQDTKTKGRGMKK